MLAIALMILCSLVHQAEGISIKKYNKKYSSGGFVFISLVSFFGLIVVVAKDLIWGGGLAFEPKLLVYGIASGVFFSVGVTI